MASSLIDFVNLAETEDLKRHLKCQWAQIQEDRTITCECGLRRAVELSFKCLFCGVFYCVNCAEVHFGQTQMEWVKKQRVKARRILVEPTEGVKL